MTTKNKNPLEMWGNEWLWTLIVQASYSMSHFMWLMPKTTTRLILALIKPLPPPEVWLSVIKHILKGIDSLDLIKQDNYEEPSFLWDI